jgi:alpha-L-fucosidase
MGDGRVPQPSIEGLAAMGAWMRVNGDAIYSTQASLIDSPICRTTTQGRRVNVFIERWVPGDVLVNGLHGPSPRAWLLADRTVATGARDTPEGLVLTLPAQPPDPVCSVVCVEFEGAPRGSE